MPEVQPIRARYPDDEICRRIDHCPRLGSLRSINLALGELLHAEQSYAAQIAEIIRRDPALTSRLLKLVNSVFFGLSTRIVNIEEAVFYLGLRQIRELGMATPVIEDFNDLHIGFRNVNWRQLWQHSIGCAILTREILSLTDVNYEDDTDYIMGLVHNVGKIVMAFAFPDEFDSIVNDKSPSSIRDVCELEMKIIGWDHARIGAYYLEKHSLSEDIVEAVRYHHDPYAAEKYPKVAAAVHIADCMVRSGGIHGIEQLQAPKESSCCALDAWDILFDEDDKKQAAYESLSNSLLLLPTVVQGMV